MKALFLSMVGVFLFIGCAQQATPIASEAIQLETMTGTLHGTLGLPSGEGPFTVMLIHPGSGPTDRNGNGPLVQANTYKLLAEALAQNGIASVRIDKRGVGESLAAEPSEQNLRFDIYVNDAVGWLRTLQQDPRFSKVGVIGHSEGALVGLLTAKRADADLYVSIAGSGERASDTLRRQLRAQLSDALVEEVNEVLSSLETGDIVAPLPESVASVPGVADLFRSNVQPYFISWFKYDPAQEIAASSIPTLIMQGTTDIQVPVEDAQMLHAAQPDAELVIVQGMNHVLKDAPAERAANLATYSDPDLPLTDGLVEPLVTFINQASE